VKIFRHRHRRGARAPRRRRVGARGSHQRARSGRIRAGTSATAAGAAL
jgi:hypothetical protein